jgi:hypothetical protein
MAFRGWLPPCIASCTDSQVQSPVHEREVVAQLLGLVALCSELSLESARMQLRLNALSPVEPIGISAPHTHTHTHTHTHHTHNRSQTAAGPQHRSSVRAWSWAYGTHARMRSRACSSVDGDCSRGGYVGAPPPPPAQTGRVTMSIEAPWLLT